MDEYEKIRCLGQGSAGSVYLVKNYKTNKLLAIKKIQLDESRKSRRKESVEKEARILSQLRHPHIVTFFDSFFEEQQDLMSLCIVQDFCDGGSLDAKIEAHKIKNKRFDEGKIMQWFIQLVMAVQYIHSLKILHRDLKTQNVFLTKNEVVKLGDFGIARTLENTIDKAMTMVGTPSHMSPELCQDMPYNNKSDIWALGCLLFEISAFEPAFDANNLMGLIYKIVKGNHADIPSIYSQDFQQLIDSMLYKDPEKRPSSSAILNLPFVSMHLNNFIVEKESLLQTWNLKRLSLKRPTSANKVRSDVNLNFVGVKGERSGCRSAFEVRNFDGLASGDSIKTDILQQQAVGRDPLDSGEYSDDFSSSEDEDDNERNSEDEEVPLAEEEEDIPEVLSRPGSADDDLLRSNCKTSSPMGKNQSPDGPLEEEEYPDDFEVDSDEDLDMIVNNARTAADLGAEGYEDDSFEEDEDDLDEEKGCRQLIERHCKDILGEKVFSEIQSKLKTKNASGITSSDLCLEFEHHIDSDLKETCFILSEILSKK
ncbi:serine/threonine-protein kinase Nek4-like [Apostichopus japonicus]|uniref:serine/threonine-protein kinase Nek4-like n=1 Tax=Stichopus japonicus TaxID=307972 RepID=UPI003AB4BC8C